MKCTKMVMFICSKGRTQSIKTCCHGQEHMPPECGENLDIPTELCSLYPHLIAFDSIHIKTGVGHVITHPKIRSCNHVSSLSSVTTHRAVPICRQKQSCTVTQQHMTSLAASPQAQICVPAKTNPVSMRPRSAKTDAAGEVRTRDPLLTHEWEADTLTTGLRQLKLSMQIVKV
jgi:hypothetical protein